MTRKLEVIQTLLEAGADPDKADGNSKSRTSYGYKLTPWKMAEAFPRFRRLFSEAKKADGGAVVYTCCWSTCGKEMDAASTKLCNRCRRVWYCGPACQKFHWRDHKSECKVACSERVAFKIDYDDAFARSVRDQHGVKRRDFPSDGVVRTCKIQGSEENGSMLGYTRGYSITFGISRNAENEAEFSRLMQILATSGVFGCKGYFNCVGTEDRGTIKIDLRGLLPLRAW